MKFKVYDSHIMFDFQKEDLTPDIKSILSMVQADAKEGLVSIAHSKIAGLNVNEIKRLGLPPVYPYRLSVCTRGRPTTPAFTYELEFLNNKSQKFYQVKRQGVILQLDGESFTLTNPHFGFLEKIKKLTPEIKNPSERLALWSEVVKIIPQEVKMSHPDLLNIQFIKADRFCVDKKTYTRDENFDIVPELVYSEEKEDDNSVTSQLPEGISLEFKDSFLNTPTVDPYYKVGNYYIKLSDTLRKCLKVIKQKNKLPLEKKQAFYSSPMLYIKEQLPEDVPEDLLEEVFFETEQFASDRISHIGKWMPKLGLYVDPDATTPWFPKDDLIVRIKDQLLHFAPDDIPRVISDMEEAHKEGQPNYEYQNQIISLNKDTIQALKEVKNNIEREAQKHMPPGQDAKNQSVSQNIKLIKDKEVAVIKDNIDHLQYEKQKKERRQYRRGRGIPGDISPQFSKYPYQKEGVLWFEDRFLEGLPGGLLADDMGLGKTFQTLAFLYWYKQQVKAKKPVLIVAPTGLLKNWQDEHKKHLQKDENKQLGLGIRYQAYGPSFRQDRNNKTVWDIIKNSMETSGYTLTTYETVRDYHKDFFIRVKWGVVVFDEIQKIKNPNSLMTDACKALDSDFSIGLTGTPIENSFIDLWCISDCLEPKILGVLKDFHESYIKNKKPDAGYEINKKLVKEKNPPFLLRRLKNNLLHNLPKRNIITKKLTMTDAQQKAYSEVVRKVKNREYSHSLEALPLLKRYSIYVEDCVADVESFIKSSAKMKFLFETLEEIKAKQEKALICVENRYLQKKIKGICDSKWNLCVSVVNGEMAGDKRKKAVDDLSQKQGFDVMIISPRAGGVGLNIVSANHIIHIDRWWNPAVEDQSNDRIFRIGQKKPVFVYHPLGVHPYYKDNSFDVQLHNLLDKKRQMRDDTLNPSKPHKYEKEELYRRVFDGEEMYSHNKENFYDSEEWKQLRKQVFGKYSPMCRRCGKKRDLQVDHVKPRCKYPDLALDFNNLQILCEDCNMLKGTKDSPEWDFRKTLKNP